MLAKQKSPLCLRNERLVIISKAFDYSINEMYQYG